MQGFASPTLRTLRQAQCPTRKEAIMDLTKMEKFLKEDVRPEELARELDEIIFNYVTAYGYSEGEIDQRMFSDNIFTLKQIRDIFKETSTEVKK